ncbi:MULTISPECIES: hypothetical protein [unclassified Pseudoxanthomonas]|jgi:hypothetical protein|uniref:hypothetical protein n=1 Tax=unclassified Pseudoxanthomonas TaxID=2645906 RepID=UPI001617FE56|nr:MULTISPECIES: hypothetical protein [unclassified Pseudoxanthomonas]MBB3277890.1 putative lipoprotein NlpE involved in copper resistance [Pseudoxanthomonas sp. OG2]MBD9375880.1 hypothetical protein [Pseudoxanthomonas sp. PXM04]MBV7474561.1 hypothetical protein [Pseudoxanthomonas sp. PXM05]UBB25890.1 hypothetical protein LAG73_02015 [Pseudoxanthomonas japonensis]
MRIIVTAMSFLLSLVGCQDKPSVTSVVRSEANGVELIHSRSVIRAGEGLFRCRASATGKCHYLIVATDECRAGESCPPRKLQAFVLDVGGESRIDNLPRGVRTCVDREREPDAATCLD